VNEDDALEMEMETGDPMYCPLAETEDALGMVVSVRFWEMDADPGE